MCSEQNLPTLYVTKVRYVRIQICIPITYKRLSGMGDSSSCESVEKKTFQASLHLLNSWNFEKFFTTIWILWITKFWVTRFGSKSTSCRTTAKVSINPCHPWRSRSQCSRICPSAIWVSYMCVYFSELSFGLVFSTLVAKLPINRCIWAQPENLQVTIEL